jgi:hypothetical protein
MKAQYEIRPAAKVVNVVAVREDGRTMVLSAVHSSDRHRSLRKLQARYGNDGERLPWPDMKRKRAR